MPKNEKAKTKNDIYQRCKKYRADHKDAQWEQVSQYLWGDQNIRRATADDQNDFVLNICYKMFHIHQSMLCRDIPSVTLRTASDLDDIRDVVQRQIVQNWRANEIGMRLVELTSNGIPFGMGFYKITWDKTMRMGLGDMRIEVPDTRNIFFMPGTGSVRKSLLMFERKIVDKLTALHLYPDQADAINALFKVGQEEDNKAGTFTGGTGLQYFETSGGSTYGWMESNYGGATDKPYIELVEAWYIDPTTYKQAPKLFEMVERTERYQKMSMDEQDGVANQPLYPRGRLCVFSDTHEFESAVNPFPSFPYVQYVGQMLPPSRAGDELPMGELDQLLEVQDMMNTRENQIMDAMDYTAMGGFGVSDGCLNEEEWTSKPKRIYTKSRPGEFDWFNPKAVEPEAFHSVEAIKEMGNDILNIHQIVSSGDTKDIRSGEGISQLTELANRVLITRSQSLEAVHRSLVRYQIYMMGSPFYKQGIHYPDTIDLSGISPDAFEIFITAGLNLPLSKQASMFWLRTLRETDAIDNEALLDNTDISILPDKDEIKARMRAKEQAAQDMANQQAGSEMGLNEARANQAQAQANVIPMNQGAQQ